jgi:glycosyltransferase involved in cell wall biosynthesis
MNELSRGRGRAPAEHDRCMPRLLFVVNSDWFFLSHRLELAQYARASGFDVEVATVDTGQADAIRRDGFPVHPLSLSRKGMHPVRELRSALELVHLYRKCRPDIVHHVTPKPVLYGSLAARLVPGIAVVNAITGLGHLFSDPGRHALLQNAVRTMYAAALGHHRSRTIFQNSDDLEEFTRRGLVAREQTELIRGAGVDCTRYSPRPIPTSEPVVVLISRMLWAKGVGDFVEAARRLRSQGSSARFVLVGAPDPGNPASISEVQLRSWAGAGDVEWWGFRADIPEVLAQANLVVLPSYYREGLPKSLLEAAASGRPIIASDVPGCREIVRPGVNGLLVPPRDPDTLATAMANVLGSAEMQERFGRAARVIAVREFADTLIFEATLGVYRNLLKEQKSEPALRLSTRPHPAEVQPR